ncbi:MAG: FMN-binding negative transcriptional regulator [Actinomycetota bacterium]|nr:FMN-binding negative transcriptional regulator [Actinomycetota bacterium]MEC8017915.1 FMN-binding negative transcriptional regulator [Actinomycetota bacterium]MEC8464146.1 FMN-binding negative transcriptional regulator [Actinomycetota bacterium]MEC8521473.1 FMN-binding negative transcriptional regulator [Actinomycetota bacterium]MED5297479.1 FMN-binding negative transcriptional regulator [Actinomycetota bacterium]|tara:strand:- start:96 stop:707 length:612 start_codon:yes stop_codon:yes gene_type:complete
MYVPPAFTMTELEALEVVRNVGAGYFVTAYEGKIQSTFLPFIVQSSPAGVRIWAHFAKANSHWRAVSDAPDCLLIVHLADAYVSPSLYPSKQVDGKVVPTWNYVTVEVRGTLQMLTDTDEEALLSTLTDLHERNSAKPWAISDAPGEFVDAQRKAIVSVELVVSEISGKAKASQNRLPEDAAAVKASFEAGSDAEQSIADWMP